IAAPSSSQTQAMTMRLLIRAPMGPESRGAGTGPAFPCPTGDLAGPVARGRDDARALPVGVGLVVLVVRPPLDRAGPPDGPLLTLPLAGPEVLLHRPVLQLRLGMGQQVVVPLRWLRRAARGGHHGVLAVVLDPLQRSLAQLARLGADRGQDDD